ncbi:MAG: SurA N-terminal domain-containing protein [Deltaproteobacteria bacterium]|nr:SurA N-terminal domain-containing protein [Deltaproteobacteria bacterium]
MLDTMRKRADSALLKGLFVVIVFVFLFWGVGTVGRNHMDVAATVNDHPILRRDFDRAYQNLNAMYRNLGADMAPPVELLREQAIAQLVSNQLMLQEASRLGLEVDEDELRDSISSMPQFQQGGRFDRDAYVQILQMNSLKPGDFEELQRQQLLTGKLQEVVRRGVHVSEQEMKDRFGYENERVNLRVMKVPAARFADQVQVSDEDVSKYYEANAEHYREPEKVSIQLVEFRADEFAAQVTPTDDDVRAYYDAHLEEYRKPEEVQARHILFKVAPDASDADKAAARKQADEVLAKAKAGEDFAALAKQYSQDSTAQNGGDLGSFGRGVMTPTFEAAAFALEPGGISDVVESPFGLHIIKLDAKSPERTQPIEEVKATIVEAIKTQKARGAALQAVQDAHERMLDGEPLEKVAADLKLPVQTPPPFVATAFRPEVAKEAFATDPGEIGEIVTEPTAYSIIKVVERIPTKIPPLDQIKGIVASDVKDQKAMDLAKAKAEEIRAGLKTGADLDAAAAREQLTVQDAKQISRMSPGIPDLGNLPDLVKAAFGLTPEAPVAPAVYAMPRDVVVAVLAERVPPDPAQFDSGKATLANRLQTQAENAALKNFLDQLKAKAKIEYGQGFTHAPTAS